MDTKSTGILGVCIIIAALIVSSKLSNTPEPVPPKVLIQQTTGRYQISNPGEKGKAYVIDTETGRVWREVVGMSGNTDGDRFYNQKLDDTSIERNAN